LIYASAGVTISSNNVSNTQGGVFVGSDPTYGVADGSTISLNRISTTHAYDGIDVCSNGNSVSKNTIYSSDESAVHLDDQCFGPGNSPSGNNNNVEGTIVNTACAGVLEGPSASGNNVGLISPNTFYNVTYTDLQGSDTCTPAFAPAKISGKNQAVASHGHARVTAMR
jgi:hypothetical protein